jgi:RNase P/RNase MRP subunit p29
MKLTHVTIAVLISLCSASTLWSQDKLADTTTVVELEKNDRTIIVGRVVSNDAKEVVIVTSGGRMYVPKHEIRRIGVSTGAVTAMRVDELGQAPFGSFYGFTQSALPHEAGQGHLQITPVSADFELYLTDRLSVGLLSSIISAPIIGRASYTFSSRGDVHFSAGGFVGWGGSVARNNAIAMPTVSVTKGDSRNNFTLSAGYGVSTFVEQLFRFAGEYQRVDYRTGELVTDTILEAVDTRVNTPRAWLSIGLIAEVSSSISLVLDAFFISDAGLAKPSTNDAFYEHEYYLLNGEYFERLLPVPGVQTYSTIIISPSIRWKMSSRTSLQFGFTGYKGNFLNLEDNSSWSSLPIPMVQWFMKL